MMYDRPASELVATLCPVHVEAEHLVPGGGERPGQGEADVPEADDADGGRPALDAGHEGGEGVRHAGSRPWVWGVGWRGVVPRVKIVANGGAGCQPGLGPRR